MPSVVRIIVLQGGSFVADRDDHWGCEKASLVEVFLNGRYAQYVAALASHYGAPVSVG